jgi:predicted  nucleic acid-binding Zn-ribbon protein
MKMAAVVDTMEKVVALLRNEPLRPQLLDRIERAEQRRLALKTEVAGLALDVQLGDRAAADRQQKAQAALAKAVDEVESLEAALSEAGARDKRAEALAEVDALEQQLAKYQGYGEARIAAIKDLIAAGDEASRASQRYIAATRP